MAIQDRQRYRRGRLLADELSQGEMEPLVAGEQRVNNPCALSPYERAIFGE